MLLRFTRKAEVAGGDAACACCMTASSSFQLGFILGLVRFLPLLFAPRPSSFRQTHLHLWRSALSTAGVIIAAGFSLEKAPPSTQEKQ